MKQYQPCYRVKQLYKDTYSIQERSLGPLSVYMYLLVGEKRALLIDSGYGTLDLKEMVRAITDKEVMCACTHGHLDHALGAHQFEQAYLHSRDFEVYERHMNPQIIRDFCYKGSQNNMPDRIVKNPTYRAIAEKIATTRYPALRPLDNIREFELGKRKITWTLLPGHTQGSVVFLDEENQTVFEGDAAPLGVWLYLPESSTVAQYIKDMETYCNYLQEHHVMKRYGGHMPFAFKKKHAEKLIDCGKYIMDNPGTGKYMETLFGKTRMVSKKGSAIFYHAED